MLWTIPLLSFSLFLSDSLFLRLFLSLFLFLFLFLSFSLSMWISIARITKVIAVWSNGCAYFTLSRYSIKNAARVLSIYFFSYLTVPGSNLDHLRNDDLSHPTLISPLLIFRPETYPHYVVALHSTEPIITKSKINDQIPEVLACWTFTKLKKTFSRFFSLTCTYTGVGNEGVKGTFWIKCFSPV